jgi:hypothetical protein
MERPGGRHMPGRPVQPVQLCTLESNRDLPVVSFVFQHTSNFKLRLTVLSALVLSAAFLLRLNFA